MPEWPVSAGQSGESSDERSRERLDAQLTARRNSNNWLRKKRTSLGPFRR